MLAALAWITATGMVVPAKHLAASISKMWLALQVLEQQNAIVEQLSTFSSLLNPPG